MKAKKSMTLQKQIDYGINQIEKNNYIGGAIAENYSNVVAYAMAFYKKSCALKKY
jgi:hypothetical protein